MSSVKPSWNNPAEPNGLKAFPSALICTREQSTRADGLPAQSSAGLLGVETRNEELMKQRLDDLESIPGVGAKIAQKLHLIGVRRVRDLRNRNPETLYRQLEHRIGAHVDRCVLYVFKAAVYYASRQKHESEKLKWWNWKDK